MQRQARKSFAASDANSNKESDIEECNWVTNLFAGLLGLASTTNPGDLAIGKIAENLQVNPKTIHKLLENETLDVLYNQSVQRIISDRYDKNASASDFGEEWKRETTVPTLVAIISPKNATITYEQLIGIEDPPPPLKPSQNGESSWKKIWRENIERLKLNKCTLYEGDEEFGFTECSANEAYLLKHTSDKQQKLALLSDRLQSVAPHDSACKSTSICDGNLGIVRSKMPQAMEKSVAKLRKKGKTDRARYLEENLEHYKEDPLVQSVIKNGKTIEDIVPLDDLWIPYLVKSKGAFVPPKKVELRVGDIRCSQNEIKAQKTFGIAKAYLTGWSSLPTDGILCAAIVDDVRNPGAADYTTYAVDGHHRLSGYSVATSGKGMMNCRMIYLPRKTYKTMEKFFQDSLTVPGILRFDLQDQNIRTWEENGGAMPVSQLRSKIKIGIKF